MSNKSFLAKINIDKENINFVFNKKIDQLVFYNNSNDDKIKDINNKVE
jgi:hypothetical protein